MPQTIVTHTCPKSGSENMVRNGHNYRDDLWFYTGNTSILALFDRLQILPVPTGLLEGWQASTSLYSGISPYTSISASR
jgi:hypothetical protein